MSVNQKSSTTPKFETRDGRMYPTADRGFQGDQSSIRDLDDHIFPVVEKKRVAVQAGSGIGMWPERMADEFDTVYTFEPNPELFHCLTQNCKNLKVIKFQAALGYSRRRIEVGNPNRDWNYGSYYITGPGAIPVLRVDDLQLNMCDLLMLDIEGAELEALHGAERTLEMCRPVVVFEAKPSCARRFGYDLEQIRTYLHNLEYRFYKSIHGNKDEIWLPKNSPFFAET